MNQKLVIPLSVFVGIFIGIGTFIGIDIYKDRKPSSPAEEIPKENLNKAPIVSPSKKIKEIIKKKREHIVSRHDNGGKKVVAIYEGEGLDERLVGEYRFSNKGSLEYFENKKNGIVEFYIGGQMVKKWHKNSFSLVSEKKLHREVHATSGGFHTYETWSILLASDINVDKVYEKSSWDSSSKYFGDPKSIAGLTFFLGLHVLTSYRALSNGKLERDFISDLLMFDEYNKYENNNYPEDIKSYLSDLVWYDNSPGGSSTPIYNMQSNATIPHPRASPHILYFDRTKHGSKYDFIIREAFVGSDFTADGKGFKPKWVEFNNYVITKIYLDTIKQTGKPHIDLKKGMPFMVEIMQLESNEWIVEENPKTIGNKLNIWLRIIDPFTLEISKPNDHFGTLYTKRKSARGVYRKDLLWD